MIEDVRRAYVRRLRNQGLIKTPRVERAFQAVPREALIKRFLENIGGALVETVIEGDEWDRVTLEKIYSDFTPIIWVENGIPVSTASQPSLVAEMLNLLDISVGHRVLEIGTGSGYNAALMAEIVGPTGQVTTVDLSEAQLAPVRAALAQVGYDHIVIAASDGYYGVASRAPFDRVAVTVAAGDVSPYWLQQLSPDGRILCPLSHGGAEPLMQVSNQKGSAIGHVVGFSKFVTPRGAMTIPPQRAGMTALPPDRQLKGRPALSGLTPQDYSNLWYFLRLIDERTRFISTGMARGFGLFDHELGIAVVASDQLLCEGDSRVEADLRAHYGAWDQLGRPSAPDFVSHFVPVSTFQPKQVRDTRWLIRREHHVQIVSLA